MKGAWLIKMKYEGEGKRAAYPPGLPPGWRRRVFHLMTNGDCPIIGANENANVPGARWDPNFQWPEPPAPPPPVEAPTQDRVNFIAAAKRLIETLTPEIAAHVRTHEPEDPTAEQFAKLEAALSEVTRGA